MKLMSVTSLKYSCSALALAVLASCGLEEEGASNTDVVETSTDIMVASFDVTEEKDWISSRRDGASSLIADGSDGQKLSLNLSPDVNRDITTVKLPEALDMSQFEDHNMAFEVENNSSNSTQLYVALSDSDGNREERSLSLPAGFKGTIFFPVSGPEARDEVGMWGVPKAWETDELKMVWRSKRKNGLKANDIAEIDFFSVGILEDRNIIIDNLRLRQNPERPDGWVEGVVDEFGQDALSDFPGKIKSQEELRKAADDELAVLAKSEGIADRSKFGGYKSGPKLEATGFFRTEKVDGKWWMVDPEGYLFFSHGPANVRMANMTTATGIDYQNDSIRKVYADEVTPEDSMGIIAIPNEIRETAQVVSEVRHKMFQWLPEYDDELADHYSYRRSTHIGPVEHGETFSFYRANLERRYGEQEPESYIKKWEQVTLDRMNDWGFTSFGNWVDPAFYPNEQVPYFANGWIIGDFQTLQPGVPRWSPMPDFFDPLFRERAEATISVIAEEVQNSPWCAGIFVDNEKAWGELEGSVVARYGVITDALSKDASESYAKAAYTEHLKEKYETIDALNAAWETTIADWDAFGKSLTFETYSDVHVADLSEMLEMLGEQYFTVVHGTLEKYLPDHLYMGARMANWGMPPEIIKASVKYSDALSFNIYENGVQEKNWSFFKDIDLPVVIGEFHIGIGQNSGMYNPGIVHAYDHEDRANAYKRYMKSVLENPYIVGAHWFQYMDEPVTGRTYDGENANIGFVTVTDTPYPLLTGAVKEVMTDLYPGRYGK